MKSFKELRQLTSEQAELDEAVKLNSKVKIHAPGKDYHGKVGHVGEIRKGLHDKAPKTYTVDYDYDTKTGNKKSIQLDKSQLKMHKEDAEQIDELKRTTLANYVSKAAGSYGRDKQVIGRESPDGTVAKARPELKRAVKNRLTGINRAAERLAKEEIEIDEASKKPNATTRHLRDYPVSDKDMAKPITYYSLVHKATNKVLSTHKDLESAKDEHRGMDQGERAHYRIATSTKAPKSFSMKEGAAEGLNEMDKSAPQPGRDGGHQFGPGPKVSKKVTKAVNKDPAKHLSDLFAKEYDKKKQGVAEGWMDDPSPGAKASIKQDKIRSLKNLISSYEEKAIAANRAGDDAKTKQHQQRVQQYKQALGKLVKEGVAEENILEGAYEKSEENKRSADAAKKQGDMFAHHLHMADHHDNLAQWHAERGRHSVADSHAAKAEEHQEKAMEHKKQGVAEAAPFSYGAKPPRKGSVAYNALMKRKEQDKNRVKEIEAIGTKNHHVGVAKVTKAVAEGYTGRETKDGTWRVFKDGQAVAVAGPFKSRDEAHAWIKNHHVGVAKVTKEEIEDVTEAKDADQYHYIHSPGGASYLRGKSGTWVGYTQHPTKGKGANILKHHETKKYYAAGGSSSAFTAKTTLHDTPQAAAKAYHKGNLSAHVVHEEALSNEAYMGNAKPQKSAHQKFKDSMKRAGYDMDAGAKRLQDLLDKQKKEREEKQTNTTRSEEASPMIKPPSNEFAKKEDAFAHAKQHGGKVMKKTFTHPTSGMQNVSYVVRKESFVMESEDEEGGMAKGELMQMAKQAQALASMMDDEKQLDSWVQSKITKAADYLDSVHDFLMNNDQEVDETEDEDQEVKEGFEFTDADLALLEADVFAALQRQRKDLFDKGMYKAADDTHKLLKRYYAARLAKAKQPAKPKNA